MVVTLATFVSLLCRTWWLGRPKVSPKGSPRAPKRDPKMTENRPKIHPGSPWHSLGCQGVPPRCLRMHIYAYLCIFCAYLCMFMHILAILLQYLCIFMHVFTSFMHIYAYCCKRHPYLCICMHILAVFMHIYAHDPKFYQIAFWSQLLWSRLSKKKMIWGVRSKFGIR